MIKRITLSLLLSTVTFVSAGKCPFGFDAKTDDTKVELKEEISAEVASAQYPVHILKCPASKSKVMTTDFKVFGKKEYMEIVDGIIALFDAVPAATAISNERAHYAGCLVRLAGHDFMDFRYAKDETTSGGADGCVNFNDADNMGLAQCLTKSKIASVYERYCDKVSLADFIVVAAEAVMGRTAPDYDSADRYKATSTMGKFFAAFTPGRTTLETCPNNHGLMPNPENGCAGLQSIFHDHIYRGTRNRRARWTLTAAISGAHTLGGAKIENSGYQGHWSTLEEQGKFNNDYYKSLLSKGWGPEKAVNGNPKKNQWKRVDMQCGGQKEFMLTTDMCLAYQDNSIHATCMKENKGSNGICAKFQKKGVFLLAQNNSCCAWTNAGPLFKAGALTKGQNNHYCGINNLHNKGNFHVFRDVCCDNESTDSTGDCDSAAWPKGPAFNSILKFSGDINAWLKAYLDAWKVATRNGFPFLAPLGVDPQTLPRTNCTHKKWAKWLCIKSKTAQCRWTGGRREGGKGCVSR